MSYKLEKPYTDEERSEFIMNYGQDCHETFGYCMKIQFVMQDAEEVAIYALEANELWDEEKQEPYANPEYEQEQLIKAKEAKNAENVAKCDEKRFNQTFSIILQEQECDFDTSSKTQSDLMAAGLVTATGATYDNWVCNNGVVINLTNADVQAIFAQFFSMVSPLYNIEKYYAELIEAATTKEEVNAIVIDYEVINENSTDIDNSNENTTV